MSGMWRAYYEKWRTMTREQLDPGLLDIVEALRHLIPPARIPDDAQTIVATGARRVLTSRTS
ncbi:hypothetical protein BS629_28060 [Rhizobium leguminosarum bv. viciae USDA 2370]|nr:hypothetical protein BS629_28060 [Rhizobium leguminosarum bv. viciae USDA 2370]